MPLSSVFFMIIPVAIYQKLLTNHDIDEDQNAISIKRPSIPKLGPMIGRYDQQDPFGKKTNESNFFLMVIFNCNKAVAYNVPHHFEDN